MAKGGIKHWKDSTGELVTVTDEWLEKGDFPLLESVKILYTWVDPPRLDANGMEMLGQARKLPNNVRDVFGYDVLIEISANKWKELSEEEKSRLMWHELNHIMVKVSAEGNVLQDSHGRVKLYIRKHDICFNTFSEELASFGLSREEMALVKTLTKVAKRQREIEVGEPASVQGWQEYLEERDEAGR